MTSIAVTGLGIVSPLGNDIPTFWRRLCAGESGISELTRFDTGGFAYTRAGQVADFALTGILTKYAESEDPATCFLLEAAAQAIAQAGLPGTVDPARIAVVVATNFGGSSSGEGIFAHAADPGAAAPDTWHRYQYQSGADAVAEAWGFCGPRQVLSLSCSSGAGALAAGADLIRTGRAKVVVAGGYDAISRFAWLGLSALKTITQDEVRPFDLNRSGTIFSEGAGVIVLEDARHAADRGAAVLAELAGCSTNNNAFHLTAPAKAGEGSAQAIRAALADAGMRPDQIDHINMHGTGTNANDVTETQAVKAVLGAHAATVPVTSIKSSLGHMLGAAGSAEAIAAILTIADGVIPPTINYQTPDPECDLDLVANSARQVAIDSVLSNSAGIGGCNAVVIFRKAGGIASSDGKGCPAPLRRVVITGLGPVSAIGIGRREFAEGLACGDDGITELTLFADERLAGLLVAELPEFALKDYFTKPKGYLDRATQLGFAAAVLALEDAGLPPEAVGGPRHGIALGTAAGCLETAGKFFADFLAKGPRFVKPILFPHTYANTTISMLAIEYGLAGPHLAFASGLVSGAQAIVAAADQIRLGRADLMLAGGVEALSSEWLSGLQADGQLSPGGSSRPGMCAPFDAGHNGMVAGEGAAILVLEEFEHAAGRGATILAELAGDGSAAARGSAGNAVFAAGETALAGHRTGLPLILAGANGLPAIDTAEAQGLRRLIAPGDHTLVTAIKSMLGETGGAAAGLQIAAGIVAAHGPLPPTLNLRSPQPEADFEIVTGTDQSRPIPRFLCCSCDPGGAACAILVEIATGSGSC